MQCPACNAPDSRVRDSRPGVRSVTRRRECAACGHRWSTTEVAHTSVRKGLPNLDEGAKAKIARLAAQGRSQSAVARDMRLSQSTVSRHWPRNEA